MGTSHADDAAGFALLMEATGTKDEDFLTGLMLQLVKVETRGQELDEAGANFLLSVIRGISPKDEVEALRAAQMATVHRQWRDQNVG